MNITVEIPDSAAADLAASGQEPARALLEAFALEGYRRQTLGESAVRRLLGFETRTDVHAFLKEHGVYLHHTQEDVEHNRAETRPYPTAGRTIAEQGLGLFGSPEDAALLDEIVSEAYAERRRPSQRKPAL